MIQRENKKVKNATIKEYKGMIFKSTLECNAFKLFEEAGFKIIKEPKIELQSSFYPLVPFYVKNKKTGNLELNKTKVRAITYSPDIVIKHKDIIFYIEVKGIITDRYMITSKLFKAWLENDDTESVFMEVHSLKEVKQAIEIIKNYERTE